MHDSWPVVYWGTTSQTCTPGQNCYAALKLLQAAF